MLDSLRSTTLSERPFVRTAALIASAVASWDGHMLMERPMRWTYEYDSTFGCLAKRCHIRWGTLSDVTREVEFSVGFDCRLLDHQGTVLSCMYLVLFVAK